MLEARTAHVSPQGPPPVSSVVLTELSETEDQGHAPVVQAPEAGR